MVYVVVYICKWIYKFFRPAPLANNSAAAGEKVHDSGGPPVHDADLSCVGGS